MLTREYDKGRGFLKRRVPGSGQVGQRYGRIQRIIDQQSLLLPCTVDTIGFTLIVLYNGIVVLFLIERPRMFSTGVNTQEKSRVLPDSCLWCLSSVA